MSKSTSIIPAVLSRAFVLRAGLRRRRAGRDILLRLLSVERKFRGTVGPGVEHAIDIECKTSVAQTGGNRLARLLWPDTRVLQRMQTDERAKGRRKRSPSSVKAGFPKDTESLKVLYLMSYKI